MKKRIQPVPLSVSPDLRAFLDDVRNAIMELQDRQKERETAQTKEGRQRTA